MTPKEDVHPPQRSDLKALADIYDQYSPGLYRYALRLLASADLAEECVAESFKRFLLAVRAGKGPRQNVRAYLFRIAHNWITDQYRREPITLPLDSVSLLDGTPSPHQVAVERAEQERVRRAMARLTPDQRQVVALKFLEDWSNEEIAEALDKPVGAVKSLQHRALASLHRLLISDEEEP